MERVLISKLLVGECTQVGFKLISVQVWAALALMSMRNAIPTVKADHTVRRIKDEINEALHNVLRISHDITRQKGQVRDLKQKQILFTFGFFVI